MPRKQRPRLIAELARLVVEYPERDWKNLADRLRDRKLMNDLAATIEKAVAVASSSAGGGTKRRESTRLGSILSAVAKQDAKKAEFLTALKARLSDKGQVSLAEIRAFAISLGMKEELPKPRPQAVNRVIRHLAKQPAEEIEAALHSGLGDFRGQGEYDRWVDLILGHSAESD